MWQQCERGHVTVRNKAFPTCCVTERWPHEEGNYGPPVPVHPDGSRCGAELFILPDQDAVGAALALGGIVAVKLLVRARWPNPRDMRDVE